MSAAPSDPLAVTLPDDLVEAIAERAAALVLAQLEHERVDDGAVSSPYLTVPEAARFLGARSRQRVDDLLSDGRLSRFKDGRRTLLSRAELESYLAGGHVGARDTCVTPSPPFRSGSRV